MSVLIEEQKSKETVGAHASHIQEMNLRIVHINVSKYVKKIAGNLIYIFSSDV